jgi:hypothetical protein
VSFLAIEEVVEGLSSPVRKSWLVPLYLEFYSLESNCMSHNDPKELVLDSVTERELRDMAAGALGKKRRLSYFERQQAHDLGLDKAVDVHGNIDLNLAANEMRQASGSNRQNPNVRTSASYNGEPGESSTHPHQKTVNVDEVVKRAISNSAACHRHCQKTTGRSQCPHCWGQGFLKGDQMHAGTRSRDNSGG